MVAAFNIKLVFPDLIHGISRSKDKTCKKPKPYLSFFASSLFVLPYFGHNLKSGDFHCSRLSRAVLHSELPPSLPACLTCRLHCLVSAGEKKNILTNPNRSHCLAHTLPAAGLCMPFSAPCGHIFNFCHFFLFLLKHCRDGTGVQIWTLASLVRGKSPLMSVQAQLWCVFVDGESVMVAFSVVLP